MLASTYTTLYTQDRRGKDAVDSVVKIAEPQPIQPVDNVPKEDSMGAGNEPNLQPKENINKDGILFPYDLQVALGRLYNIDSLTDGTFQSFYCSQTVLHQTILYYPYSWSYPKEFLF